MSIERNDLEYLAIALANAKRVEDEAKIARLKAEEELAAAIGGKEIGSTSVKCGCLGVTVKRGYNYKIETPKSFADKYPDFVRVKEDIKLNEKVYESTRENNPSLFDEVARYVCATPKKVSVDLKV